MWFRSFILAAFASCALAGISPARAATEIITTTSGPITGVSAHGVREFLGIPYAAPPVGPLRWMPPREPAPWTQPLAATKYANFCPEATRGVFASPSVTEDCLYLNVVAPAAPRPGQRKLPVMVWLYGGGLFSGETNDYDGSKLAHSGNVIYVSMNYRAGVFGFFSHPAINAEGHTAVNYGIMDQQFALRWVQRNIAKFGGDPQRVTLFGQSGGATAVMANLVSPTAFGLFSRAIVESGTHIDIYPPADALKAGQDFATAAGCPDQTAACLRALPVETILKNQNGLVRYIANDFPSVDGTVITHTAYAAFTSGQFNRVPIVTGLVHDEQAFFLPELNTGVALTAGDYAQYAATFGARNVPALTAKYPLAAYASPSLAEIALAQGYKACTADALDRAWSQYVPVYAYEFDDQTVPPYAPPVSYPLRAFHTAELEYLFPGFHGGSGTPHRLNDAQHALSDQMVAYWTNFAKHGAPNAAGLANWPKYEPAADAVLSLDIPAPKPLTAYGASYDCALWNSILTF